jgi:5-methylcytosine-specific restriction endonuclease McrA
MPAAAPRFCPRCRSPHPAGIECRAGRAERLARIDANRPGARRRGYSREWQRARAEFLAEHPYCRCGAPASEVHHTTPHRGDPGLFWDQSRWRSLCKGCHSAATLAEIRERKSA